MLEGCAEIILIDLHKEHKSMLNWKRQLIKMTRNAYEWMTSSCYVLKII